MDGLDEPMVEEMPGAEAAPVVALFTERAGTAVLVCLDLVLPADITGVVVVAEFCAALAPAKELSADAFSGAAVLTFLVFEDLVAAADI